MKSLAKKVTSLAGLSFLFSISAFAAHEQVHFETSLGNFDVELFTDEAPITVANFLSYVDSGFFKDTIFHRIVPGFVAQGGGLTPDLQEKPTQAPIKNESGNGLSNVRGTLAMARTQDVDSATSQFFVNLVDNTRLNHVDNTPAKFGYAVFGKVVSGMDVLDQMQKVPEHTVGEYDNVPVTPIRVQSVTRIH